MGTYKNVYSNGEVIVTYEPSRCIHAEACAKGLSEVFKTSVIPWIDLDGASTKKIISQVKKCPSGALSCTKIRPKQFVKDFVIWEKIWVVVHNFSTLALLNKALQTNLKTWRRF